MTCEPQTLVVPALIGGPPEPEPDRRPLRLSARTAAQLRAIGIDPVTDPAATGRDELRRLLG